MTRFDSQIARLLSDSNHKNKWKGLSVIEDKVADQRARGRRRITIVDDVKNGASYALLKKDAQDRCVWRDGLAERPATQQNTIIIDRVPTPWGRSWTIMETSCWFSNAIHDFILVSGAGWGVGGSNTILFLCLRNLSGAMWSEKHELTLTKGGFNPRLLCFCLYSTSLIPVHVCSLVSRETLLERNQDRMPVL